ncbi:hypothetical protein [Nakamurella sp.]|uniref:hypothetical protein n=1 Tax=Nakamurella sp. TaxID=1869182 RepID=UPI003B3A88C7
MSVRGGRSAGPVAARLAAAAVVLAVLVGCRDTPAATGTAAPGSAPAAAVSGEATISDADRAAIRATVDAVNATAGGPVAAQQAELLARTDPDRRGEVQRCPDATTTVRFEPVDRGLRAAPGSPDGPDGSIGSDGSVGSNGSNGSTGSGGKGGSTPATAPGGTAYRWPALIRIYSGDRVVGTDLTTLQIIVRSGGTGVEAYLTPFCVN